MADANTVLEFARKHDVKILDLRFTDIPGLWHHLSYPIEQLTEASFEEGFGIDGSSIRGWAAIHESDMLLKPDPNFHLLDPFTEGIEQVKVGVGLEQHVAPQLSPARSLHRSPHA